MRENRETGPRLFAHVVLLLLVSLDNVVAQSVPEALCSPGDRTESIQGQTTLAERYSSTTPQAYRCNLVLIGSFQSEGTAGFMQLFDRCAYFSTWPNPKMHHPGVAVIDLSDLQNIRATAYLDTPAMHNANQSLEIDPRRGLLLAANVNDSNFDIYDVSIDCRRPTLKRSAWIDRTKSHVGQFIPQRDIYVGASCCTRPGVVPTPQDPPRSAIFAIDTSDPLEIKKIATWIPSDARWNTHGVSVSGDGARAYVSILRQSDGDPNGLAILDSSEFTSGQPRPQFNLISSLFWNDTWASEFVVRATVQGRPYLIFSDILGSLGNKGACTSDQPAYGFPRIIDTSDDRHPFVVSKLMLKVHEPRNCPKVAHDTRVLFGYGSLACGVDNPDDTRLLACGYNEGGLRVFDIRDPAKPKEIAYYKPAAARTQSRPGSVFRSLFSDPATSQDHTADQVMHPIFRGGGLEIVFVSADNGLQVVRFSDQFRSAHPDLFRR